MLSYIPSSVGPFTAHMRPVANGVVAQARLPGVRIERMVRWLGASPATRGMYSHVAMARKHRVCQLAHPSSCFPSQQMLPIPADASHPSRCFPSQQFLFWQVYTRAAWLFGCALKRTRLPSGRPILRKYGRER